MEEVQKGLMAIITHKLGSGIGTNVTKKNFYKNLLL